jgi:hypothetical protein
MCSRGRGTLKGYAKKGKNSKWEGFRVFLKRE